MYSWNFSAFSWLFVVFVIGTNEKPRKRSIKKTKSDHGSTATASRDGTRNCHYNQTCKPDLKEPKLYIVMYSYFRIGLTSA